MALVSQKIWVVCQAAGNWRPFSVREPGDHRVCCPVLGLDKADDRERNQGPSISDEVTKTNVKSQKTVRKVTAGVNYDPGEFECAQ